MTAEKKYDQAMALLQRFRALRKAHRHYRPVSRMLGCVPSSSSLKVFLGQHPCLDVLRTLLQEAVDYRSSEESLKG